MKIAEVETAKTRDFFELWLGKVITDLTNVKKDVKERGRMSLKELLIIVLAIEVLQSLVKLYKRSDEYQAMVQRCAAVSEFIREEIKKIEEGKSEVAGGNESL